ncbi:MAG: nicotinate-nucleotide adenylyltransferase [Candidatus Cloacimonadales bacterium]
MKIGLLGGSFNPIHKGHLKIAETVLAQTEIEKIWFVPSGNHPLKASSQLLDINQRISLIQKVISDYPDFELCTLDAAKAKPSYTSELIKKLTQLYPQHKFYFIAGSDIVAEIPLWHDYRWLLSQLNFIILSRSGVAPQEWKKLDYLDKLDFLEMQPIDISASQIRAKVSDSEDISALVPQQISAEVEQLYKK